MKFATLRRVAELAVTAKPAMTCGELIFGPVEKKIWLVGSAVIEDGD